MSARERENILNIERMPRTELFVGNLTEDIAREDVEDVFRKYGKLIKCDVKSKGTGNFHLSVVVFFFCLLFSLLYVSFPQLLFQIVNYLISFVLFCFFVTYSRKR